MDKIDDNTLKIISSFLELLKSNNINIQTAYLFGSYANNTANKYSDIDIAIVSDDFTGDLWEDKKTLRNYKSKISWDISPLPLNKYDFENSKFVQDEIIGKGIRLL